MRVGARDGEDVVEPDSEFRELALAQAVVEPERLGDALDDGEPVRVGAATVPLTVGQRDGDDDTLLDWVAVLDSVVARLSNGCPDAVTEMVEVRFGLVLVEADMRGDVETVMDVNELRVRVAQGVADELWDAVLQMLVVGDAVDVDNVDAEDEPVDEPQNDALGVAQVEAEGVSDGVCDTHPVDDAVREAVAQPVPVPETELVDDAVVNAVDVELVEKEPVPLLVTVAHADAVALDVAVDEAVVVEDAVDETVPVGTVVLEKGPEIDGDALPDTHVDDDPDAAALIVDERDTLLHGLAVDDPTFDAEGAGDALVDALIDALREELTVAVAVVLAVLKTVIDAERQIVGVPVVDDVADPDLDGEEHAVEVVHAVGEADAHLVALAERQLEPVTESEALVLEVKQSVAVGDIVLLDRRLADTEPVQPDDGLTEDETFVLWLHALVAEAHALILDEADADAQLELDTVVEWHAVDERVRVTVAETERDAGVVGELRGEDVCELVDLELRELLISADCVTDVLGVTDPDGDIVEP